MNDYLNKYLNKEVEKEIKVENFVIQKPRKKLFTFSLNPENVERLKALIEAEAEKRNAEPLSMSEVLDILIGIAIKVIESSYETPEQAEPAKEEPEPKCYYCGRPAKFVGEHRPSMKEYPLCQTHTEEVMDKAPDKWSIKPLPGERAVFTEAVAPPGPEHILRLLRNIMLELIFRPEGGSESPKPEIKKEVKKDG